MKYDLVVIGAGSGGVRAARTAASRGAKVAVVESRFYGGTCVNVGCVPKKLFAYGSEFNSEFRLGEDFGFSVGELAFDWATLRDNKTREIERLNEIYQRLLNVAGVTIYDGHGQITGPGEVMVEGEVLRAEHILVATGGKPRLPAIPGGELAMISDDLFYLDQLPRKVAVVGGGFIACEFASILHGLGCEVHQIYRGELFLRGFDHSLREFVARQMSESGIHLHFNSDVSAISEADGGLRLDMTQGDWMDVDQVFYAIGREANLDGLFARPLDPLLNDNGALLVDDSFATSIPGIYAIGDVIDRVQLTPVALAEAMWLVDYLFAETPPSGCMDYSNIPTAVFCHPNLATVGMTEEQALQEYGKLRIYNSEFRPLRYSLGQSATRSIMKLVVDDASDRVLGVHMAGPEAAEIVQGFAVAVKMGASKADFDRTIGIHPTSAEEFVTMRQARTSDV